MPEAQQTVHALVGGDVFFVDLVDRFYDGVGGDPVLRPMYPEDLTESKRHMAGFLIQYWGGSTSYSDERGHPRLRMRHAPFEIGVAARDAWYRHMLDALRGAVEEHDVSADVERAMREYFEMASEAMRNAE